MKKHLVFFSIIILFFSCHKEKENNYNTTPADYRDSFVGNYQVHRLCTFWIMSNPVTDTTCNQDMVIIVKKSAQFINKLIVENDTIPIDSSGVFTSGLYEIPNYKIYSISFKNDSIYLYTFNGGLGGGTTCNTKGKK